MTRQVRWIAATGFAFASTAAAFFAAAITSPSSAVADDCPNGVTVRFGVEPYDTSARLTPIYEKIGKMISEKIGCKVEIYVATGYNAEIEASAMASSRLANLVRSAMCWRIKSPRPRPSRHSATLKTSPSHTGRAW